MHCLYNFLTNDPPQSKLSSTVGTHDMPVTTLSCNHLQTISEPQNFSISEMFEVNKCFSDVISSQL